MEHSPLVIETVLACYWSGDPEHLMRNDVRFNSIAGRDARRRLVEWGLIDGRTLKVTDRGIAWVESICSTPIPETV